jgi:hypothetical protein
VLIVVARRSCGMYISAGERRCSASTEASHVEEARAAACPRSSLVAVLFRRPARIPLDLLLHTARSYTRRPALADVAPVPPRSTVYPWRPPFSRANALSGSAHHCRLSGFRHRRGSGEPNHPRGCHSAHIHAAQSGPYGHSAGSNWRETARVHRLGRPQLASPLLRRPSTSLLSCQRGLDGSGDARPRFSELIRCHAHEAPL